MSDSKELRDSIMQSLMVKDFTMEQVKEIDKIIMKILTKYERN